MTEQTKKKIVKWMWIVVCIPIALVICIILAVWAFADIPSIEELENPESKLATQVIADGGEILTTYHIENRVTVSYQDLPQNLIDAVVATEDVRFYQHSGIDMRSLGRVAFKTILMGNSSQGGGSTITQQLAKTLYPRSGGGKLKMVWIKLKEWFTAVKLERNYTKEEILSMYLNTVFFGSNSYGIQSASMQFFGKAPIDLTTEESAVLVGMINKPTRYNPNINPDKSLSRRNFVLSQMESAGYLDKHECDSIQQIPIVTYKRAVNRTTGVGPYFRDMLKRTMSAKKPKRNSYYTVEDYRIDSLQWEEDPLYGWIEKNPKADGSKYDLETDGLRIYTTINFKMQKYAEEAVAEHLGKDLQKSFNRELSRRKNPPFSSDTDPAAIELAMKQARRWSDRNRAMKERGCSDAEILKSFSEKTEMRVFSWNKQGYVDTVMTPDDSIRYCKSFLRAAFMAIEPYTGHIKAYVGGPNYSYFKYDNVRQGKRQVGSTIKPFLYTLAMESGMTPCDAFLNVPQTVVVNGDETWQPADPHADGQTVTLKWGLEQSSNSASAYLMKQLGPEALIHEMRKMGVGSYLDPVVSLCVGAADLSVYEMVAAYNVYPSQGVYTSPLFVTRIEDCNGNVLSTFSARHKEAVQEKAVNQMISMMEGVVNNGTGRRLRGKYALRGRIAGKTGTTNDQSDGWFIGYTPKITAGVWVGGEDRNVHFNSMTLGQGSNMALPIWGIWMKKLLKDGGCGISEADMFPMTVGDYCGGYSAETGEEPVVSVQSEEEYFFE